MHSRVSLAPPPSETDIEKAQDKWADPAMPENFQLLLPHTQQLLRIARSGKYGTKRKIAPDVEPDGDEFNAREEEGLPDEILAKPTLTEERGFVARKWRQVPESALVPEHLHWEFLAKRRKGLPSYYHGVATEISTAGIPQIAKRKTRVQRVLDPATGESVIYEVLALEGQVLENELPADSQMPAIQLEPGTTVEGLGTADDDGLISLVPSNASAPSRRNRPPPKKKGGPGRGKKRVTFTNPDGSTYTTIVPNATKIVPQPGQTVKHVAKGEDAGKDVSMEEAARQTNEAGEGGEHDDEGDDDEDDEEGDDGDDDDDDREDGEIQEEDAEIAATPARKEVPAEPVVIEPTAAEATVLEPQLAVSSAPGASAPATPHAAPADIVETIGQPHTQSDADVEMQDRDADEDLEAKLTSNLETDPAPESQPAPEMQPEPPLQPEPELQPEAESQPEPRPEPEADRQSPPRPETQEEASAPADDAPVNETMDLEPAEAVAPREATPPIADQPLEVIDEPTAPLETKSEELLPVVEVERKSEIVESASQTVGNATDVEDPAAAAEPLERAAEPVIEAPVPEASEPPRDQAEGLALKTFEDGDEDLLGSLERSLGN